MGSRFVERGGLWVLVQMPLMVAAIAIPWWTGSLADAPMRWIGAALWIAGLAAVVWSRRALGRSFTPFPRPVEGGAQVSGGPYRFVRHPIYTAVIATLGGWALMWQSWIGAALTLAVAVLLDAKARHEERWLAEAYPGYAEYKGRTRKLVPFLY